MRFGGSAKAVLATARLARPARMIVRRVSMSLAPSDAPERKTSRPGFSERDDWVRAPWVRSGGHKNPAAALGRWAGGRRNALAAFVTRPQAVAQIGAMGES